MSDIQLTKREKECLLLSSCGLREAEIARELEISPHTVRVHMVNAKKRLGASNKSHSIVLALLTNNLELSEVVHSSRFIAGNSDLR
ncbi:MAG: helix-turn-helix domain-containing protein [Methyloligellaceae bacterium]